MRRLPTFISTVALAAAATLTFSCDTHAQQQLEWVHRSQLKSPRPAATPSRPAATSQPEIVSLPPKQPTFRQPEAFEQPVSAKPIPRVEAAPAPEQPAAPVEAQRPRLTTAQRVAAAPRLTAAARRPATLGALASGVHQVQHEQAEELPAGEAPEYSEGEVIMGPGMYAGDGYYPSTGGYGCCEAGCGCPEPTCGYDPGCGAPCCGDSCYLGDPGCGVPGGPVFPLGARIFGEVGCGVPCGDGCCGGCVDGACCCGEVCEPGCGCEPGCCDCCGDCVSWPQALFGCDERGCVPILWVPPIKEVTFFGGVHGFKGPLDGGRDGGNFGFQEGFNIGGKMAWLPWPGLGYQFGYQATQSQLSGDSNTGASGAHSQSFLTTGLFHRQPGGLQYGLVWDWLNDERHGSHNFGQVRGQIGFNHACNREWGFLFALNSRDNLMEDDADNVIDYHSADQYLGYYTLYGRNGGDLRLLAGFSDDSNVIVGSDFNVPLNNRWALNGTWRYLIPEGGSNGSGADEEAWNIGMNLVWHYGCRAKTWNKRPYRPMFNVADNGSFIVVD